MVGGRSASHVDSLWRLLRPIGLILARHLGGVRLSQAGWRQALTDQILTAHDIVLTGSNPNLDENGREI